MAAQSTTAVEIISSINRLDLALCEIWFQTDHTTKDHHAMSVNTVSRAALAVTGRNLRLHESILTMAGSSASKMSNAIAETLEAVLGAIYVDSSYSVQAVKDVIRRLRIADHQYLQTRKASDHDDESRRVSLIDAQMPNSQQPHPKDAMVETDASKSGINAALVEDTNTLSFVDRSDKKTPVDLQPQASPNKTSIKYSHIYGNRVAVRNIEPEPQPQPSDQTLKPHQSAPNLQELEPLKNPIRISAAERKQAQVLKAWANKSVRGFKRRKEAARRALREHATQLKQGTQSKPLKVYVKIRKEMGKFSTTQLKARAEEPAGRSAETQGPQDPMADKVAERALDSVDGSSISSSAGQGTSSRKHPSTTAPVRALKAPLDRLNPKENVQRDTCHAKSLGLLEEDIIRSHGDAWTSFEPSMRTEPRNPHKVTEEHISHFTSEVTRPNQAETTVVSAGSDGVELNDADFYESEVDLAGFMTFETQPRGVSTGAKKAEVVERGQTSANRLHRPLLLHRDMFNTQVVEGNQKSETYDTQHIAGPATSSANSIFEYQDQRS
ncbi:hypothetical protein EK21DRAFT_85008 [Setomelanomma holmii]|uniref:RNase III domain-containing protein n=1 Tax=Setomelanomma holmii TaxID=210430 RepID=A0A9P4LSL5_9PLEO|nr:hypothetical protein EK21DRAFT_85008 [Setomelanomma holmii]